MKTPMRRAVLVAILGGFIAGMFPSTAWGSLPQDPNDPGFSEQWAVPLIGAPEAWQQTTGEGVRIGIVDTGVDLNHEDLAGKVEAHTSCVGSGGDPAACQGSGQDDNGHGTHVAGIAAAATDNGTGIAGVAPDAQLVVAKALDASGSGTSEDVVAGIKWVVDHGAQVVNLSLGGLSITTALFGSGLDEGIAYAWEHGVPVVLSSGNDNLFGLGLGSQEYGDLDALVVGATGPDDGLASYSSPTGSAKWSLLAPGGAGGDTEKADIYSTWWAAGASDQYRYLAGTSMAAPHVTGAVALLLAQGYDAQQAVDRILATVDTSVSCGVNSPTCHGRLDVARAAGVGG
jgi:serine protease